MNALLIITSSITAIATGVIAWATIKYMNYSKENISKLNYQNELLNKQIEFSENYERFKITNDLIKEYGCEIEKTNEIMQKYYNRYSRPLKKYLEFDPKDRNDFIANYLRFSDYFSRVYIMYKRNKMDEKLFLENMAGGVIVLKEDVYDGKIAKLIREKDKLKLVNFLKLYEICKKYIGKEYLNK